MAKTTKTELNTDKFRANQYRRGPASRLEHLASDRTLPVSAMTSPNLGAQIKSTLGLYKNGHVIATQLGQTSPGLRPITRVSARDRPSSGLQTLLNSARNRNTAMPEWGKRRPNKAC